jgi:ribosomal protein S18 acetylase RimI-like enzyme
MVTMRQATPADAAAVRALTREAYHKWVAVTGREPLPMRVDYAEALQKHRFDLLYDGDTLAALIETALEPDGPTPEHLMPAHLLPAHLLIVNVAVAPSFQKRGFGRRLMAHAETIAAEAGLSTILLYTNSLMAENIALYRRLGYRIDREQPFGTSIQVYMSKSLTGGSARKG